MIFFKLQENTLILQNIEPGIIFIEYLKNTI